MSDMDDFPEGDATSAPADVPGAVPADDTPDRAPAAKQGGFDSSSITDAPVIRRSAKTAHTAEARKAFAAAILADKAKPAPTPTGAAAEVADLDPEAAPIAASADVAAAKAAGTMAPPAKEPPKDIIATPPPVAPPAPSLDPEVRKLKEQLAADRRALEQERAELEKAKQPAPSAAPVGTDLEDYLDSPTRSYRTWLETMRGEKFASDDEFKAEVSDFITQASAEVLGVPLPENTRTKLDAALARKAVRMSKSIQARKEAAAAAKAEADRKAHEERTSAEQVEREWSQAAQAVSQQFASRPDHTGALTPAPAAQTYPWLAAEDEPGKIVVDVIRAALNKDGTQMSWQEASKKANDFLAEQSKAWHEKRKALLQPAAPAAPAPKAPPVAVQPPPAPPPTPENRPPAAPNKWTREKHLEGSKAAFRRALSGE